jgi:hypothetical protein
MALFAQKCLECGQADKTVAWQQAHPKGKVCSRCLASFHANAELEKQKLPSIILSTGDLRRDYEIVEVVMTLQADRAWDVAWTNVLYGLRRDALKLGCNAVINIRVEHRIFSEHRQGFLGNEHIQGVEFFGCGTAVKFTGR